MAPNFHPVWIMQSTTLNLSRARVNYASSGAFVLLALLLLGLLAPLLRAADEGSRPFISPVFGENMVLQRNKPNTFWGWTKPGATVKLSIGESVCDTKAGEDGRWSLTFAPPAAGGPYKLRIEGEQTLEWSNILVGDVWLCGGQSNMQFALQDSKGGAEAVEAAELPNLRFFRVPTRVAYAPAEYPVGSWKVCSPRNVSAAGGGVSAVGFYFARLVNRETGVPIGLVESYLGGSPGEAWMSADALRSLGGQEDKLTMIGELAQKKAYPHGSFLMHWLEDHDQVASREKWSDGNFAMSDWKDVTPAKAFEQLGLGDEGGIVWFRTEVEVTAEQCKVAARLNLGWVDKMDTAYVNGQWVGMSSWVENPRSYFVKSGMLHPGRNTIIIRVFRKKGGRGFVMPDKLALDFKEAGSVKLDGRWVAKASFVMNAETRLPLDYENYPTMPVVLYQGMVRPLAPLALTGFLWYQGEANTEKAYAYRGLLPALIADWRRTFSDPEAPFYVAGLPAFMKRRAEPGTDGWAELREAQALTAKTVPGCGLAVTIDTGEADNIHPKDKAPVGERLAALALTKHYGRTVPCAGPEFAGLEKLPGALRVRFTHAEGGLVSRDPEPGEFSLAGADGKWVWAEARLEGESVVVSSPQVPEPVAVRYAWQGNPKASLFNKAGLPATPFRSDDWKLSTQK